MKGANINNSCTKAKRNESKLRRENTPKEISSLERQEQENSHPDHSTKSPKGAFLRSGKVMTISKEGKKVFENTLGYITKKMVSPKRKKEGKTVVLNAATELSETLETFEIIKRDVPVQSGKAVRQQKPSPDSRAIESKSREEEKAKRGGSPLRKEESPVRRNKSPDSRGKSPDSRGKSPDSRGKSPDSRGKSPDSRGKSPDSRGKSPDNRGKSPDSREKSPDRREKSPDSREKTPDRREKTPARTGKSQDSREKSPDRREKSAARTGKSPVRAGKSPVRAGKSPVRREKSPVRGEKSPVKTAKSPVKTGKSPLKTGKSPLKTVNSPVRSNGVNSKTGKASDGKSNDTKDKTKKSKAGVMTQPKSKAKTIISPYSPKNIPNDKIDAPSEDFSLFLSEASYAAELTEEFSTSDVEGLFIARENPIVPRDNYLSTSSHHAERKKCPAA